MYIYICMYVYRCIYIYTCMYISMGGIQYCLTSLFGYLSADLSICIMRLYM